MSDNWVVQNLENALATWNEKLAEIWQLITQSPETFKGGTIWNVVLLIHDTMQAIGLALLVLFFVVGVVKTCGSFAEIKRPEAAVKLFSPAIFIPVNAKSIPAPTKHPPQISILISQYTIPATTGLDIPLLICAMFFPVSISVT